MNDKIVWYQGIRDIHDRHFHDSWEERVDAINRRYDLAGDHMVLTHGPGIPMPWFNGDIEAIEPGNWVLAISLNHQLDRDGIEMLKHQASGISPEEAWWRQRRRMNTDRCYGQFFDPLARVAATALGEQLQREDEPEFATNRMIFVEICPYASNRFNMGWRTVAELLASDLGFQLAARVNHLLIHEGDPALVMINGGSAIAMVQHLYADALDWERIATTPAIHHERGASRKRCAIIVARSAWERSQHPS